MRKVRVGYKRMEFTTITVEVEDDVTDEEAEELAGKRLDELSLDRCAQCSGWNQDWSVDTSADWEFDEILPPL